MAPARIDTVQDSRKFFMLPQGFEGGGYYTYGTPDNGRSQYAHPRLISLVNVVSIAWCEICAVKFGIGNISLADGKRHADHATHRSGLEMDVRPLRKDGRQLPCSFRQAEYDRELTARLIQLFVRNPVVKTVLFNDISIPGVRAYKGHDDHFHVQLKA